MKKMPLRVGLELSMDRLMKDLGAKSEGNLPSSISGVVLDTRAIEKGDLFFALEATRDGHEFVEEAFKKGAAACVVARKVKGAGPLLLVGDTGAALAALAKNVRARWDKTVVGISGSNGKTTTKEMTAAVLGVHCNVLKAPGTWNNNLGIPLSIFGLRAEHDVAVLEMGINDFGEMTTLAEMAKPNVGMLTNIGPVHLEKFKSLDGVAKAKGELFEALGSSGIAVINEDDRHIRDLGAEFKGRKITVSTKGSSDVSAEVVRDLGMDGLVLRVRYGGETLEIRSPFLGVHNIYNLLCAFGAALAIGVPAGRLQAGVDSVQRPEMRLELVELEQGIRVVNDCYNANPASMAVAIEIAKSMARGRVAAVLGDMMELGEIAPRAHRDTGIKVAKAAYAHLFILGQFSGDVRQGAIQGGMRYDQVTVGTSHAELAAGIAAFAQPGDTILVKGSRGMRMEEVTQELGRLLKERNR